MFGSAASARPSPLHLLERGRAPRAGRRRGSRRSPRRRARRVGRRPRAAVTPARVSRAFVEGQQRDDREPDTLAHRRDRVDELVEVVERLEHEQVGAAALEHRRLLGEELVALALDVAASPIGPIAPAMKTSRPEISRASRASFTPIELIFSSSSSRKCAASLRPVGAERVRLDQLRAGVDEAEVQRDDRLGRAEVRLLGRAQTRHGGGDQRAHAAVGDDRRALAEARLEAAGHTGLEARSTRRANSVEPGR